MTHQHVHVHDHEHPHLDDEHRDDGGGGLEMEKWLLRSLLLGLMALIVTAVVASLDDIKRYLTIRRM